MRASHTAPVLSLSESGVDEHKRADTRTPISARLLRLAQDYISASVWTQKREKHFWHQRNLKAGTGDRGVTGFPVGDGGGERGRTAMEGGGGCL